MSNVTPSDMNSFLELITNTTDTKMKLFICSKLLTYVANSSNSIVCSDIGLFIDTLVNWLQSSNFKLIQIDLDILTELVNRMRTDFQPYLSTLVPPLVDKLGDSKDTIRERALCLFRKLVECDVVTLQNLFDRIAVACFSHKNSNVREQIMHLLTVVLDEYGAASLSISKLVPHVVKLLSDPNAAVRATAFDTLCHIYKHVGERLRVDLQKKFSIPHNKLPALMTKFDEIKASSDDNLSSIFQSLKVEDETDQSDKSSMKSGFNSVSASRPPITPSSLGLSLSSKSKLSSIRKPNSTNNQAGAIDEDTFLASFEDVPTVQIYSGRDLEDNIKKCQSIIENVNEDWSKRVDSLKKIRSLIVAGALKYEEFYFHLNLLLPSFNASLKDLRSQVVREACITVAYFSKNLTAKFDHFAESVLSSLINLIQNSAKVIASSGLICIRFILKNTHTPRLIPIIANGINSKSKEIRKACCEFINLILQTWQPHSIERHASTIQEAIKKGIADADADARAQSRNAYREFSNNFPELAETLKNSLDYPYRKLLNSNSNSGSNTSLSRIPAASSISVRSNSAIDLQAAKRANARSHYAAMNRQKYGSGVSTPRMQNQKVATPSASDQRVGRTKSRISVSQPTSRSGSPSSRLSYTNYFSGSISRSKRNIKPVSAQKILQQSREAETELADALGNCDSSPYSFRPSSRNLYRGLDDHSDESETSSICSEQSFDSYRRPSDTMSWNGSQHRLYRDCRETACKDISEIIANCENAHWNERREGLQSLQYYVQDGNKLDLSELKRIMDVFTKIFNDPHIKVFSLFLDSLNEVIRSHSEDLCFCLHLLLTRLFNKLGTDLLNSVHSKIMKTLDIVFESFPADLQLQSVFRFLVDPTQTPNSRVKLAALNYIIKLTSVVDPCSAFSSSVIDTNKDHASMALSKMVGWTITDNLKVGPELRRVARETVLALFNLNPAQVTRRFSAMSQELQEAAANVCKNRSSALNSSENDSFKTSTPCDFSDIQLTTSICKNKYSTEKDPISYDSGIGDKEDMKTSSSCDFTDFHVKDNDVLKTYIEELSQSPSDNVQQRKELLSKITSLVQDSPSDVIITHFKLLLGNMVNLLRDSEPSIIKEMTLNLLQLVVKRKTVTFLLKNYSDLIITKTIAVCSDPSKDVVKAAENCAITLSTHLPAELVIRVVVPLIQSEPAPAKLVAIKMLTRLIECSDNSLAIAEIDKIMNVLLVAYDDTESSVRKAAVFCMVALHKQSEKMKEALEPYINRLQGAKLKLLQLYIRRAEKGSSMPTSPKNSS